ncbi:hypothetical protein CHCC14821_2750 [Bacillus paralicheniformis]|nr:hypothetical protein CHCC14821_2750 [Bacillus paralicheniformis]
MRQFSDFPFCFNVFASCLSFLVSLNGRVKETFYLNEHCKRKRLSLNGFS